MINKIAWALIIIGLATVIIGVILNLKHTPIISDTVFLV